MRLAFTNFSIKSPTGKKSGRFFLALFLFIAVHSTIKPPLSTIMVEKALLSKNEKIANDSAK